MIQEDDKARYRVDFYLDPSYDHDIHDSAGYFYWEKIDDKSSLITYAVTKLDVGIPVPRFIVKALSSRDLPGILENLKKRIESNAKWRKQSG